MDPIACVRRILDLVTAKKFEKVGEAVEDLRIWLARGGATPYGWTRAQATAFLDVAATWVNP